MESKRLSTNTCSDYSDDEISFGPRSRTTTPSLSQPSTPLRPLVEEEHVDVHSPKAMPKTGMQLDIKKLNLTPKSEIRRSLEPIASDSLPCQRMLGFDDVGESTEKELLAHACDFEAIGESTKKDIIERKYADDFDQLFDKEVEAVKNSHNISITDLCDSITKMDLDCSMEKRGSLSKNTSPYVPGEVRTEIHNLGNLLLSEVNKSSTTVFISEEEEEELLGGSFHGQEEDPHVENVSQFDYLLDQEDSKGKSAKPDEIKMSEIVKYYEHKYNRSFDQLEAEQVEEKGNVIILEQNVQLQTDTITGDAVTTVNPVEETVESGVYEGVGESSFLYKSLDIPQNEDSFVVLPNPVSGDERLSKSQFQEFAVQASQDVSNAIPSAQVISPEKVSSDESVIVIPEPHIETTGDDMSEIDLSAYLVGNDLIEKREVEDVALSQDEENSEADLSKYLGQDENLDNPVLHKMADALQYPRNTEEKPDLSSQENSGMDNINNSEKVSSMACLVHAEVEEAMVKGKLPVEKENVNTVTVSNEKDNEGIVKDNPLMAEAEQACIEVVDLEVITNITPEQIIFESVPSNNLDNESNLSMHDSKTVCHTELIVNETKQVCLVVGTGNNEVQSHEIENSAAEKIESPPTCCNTESAMLQPGDEGGLQINSVDKSSTKDEISYTDVSETSIPSSRVENESIKDVEFNADHLATDQITIDEEPTGREVVSSHIDVELSNSETETNHLETATVTQGCKDQPSISKVDPENTAGELIYSLAQAVEERSEMVTSAPTSDKTNKEPVLLSSVVGEEPIIDEVRTATIEDEIEIMEPEDEPSAVEIETLKTETEIVLSKDETFSSKEVNFVAVQKEHCEVEKYNGEAEAELAQVNVEPASCSMEVEPINDSVASAESVKAEVGPVLVGGEVIPTCDINYTELVHTQSEQSNLEVGLNKSESDHASFEPITECKTAEMEPVDKAKPYTIECESDAVEVEPITAGSEPTCTESEIKTEEDNPVNNELEVEQAEGDSNAVEVEPITAEFTTECESKGAKVEPVSVESEPTSIETESKTEEVNNELEFKQAEGDSDAVEVEPITADFTTECESKGAEVEPVSIESEPTSIETESKTEEVNNELELKQAEGDSDAVEVEPITADFTTECESKGAEVDPVSVESEPTSIGSESKTDEVNNELEFKQAEGDSDAVEVEPITADFTTECESKGAEVEPVSIESEPTSIETESKTEEVNNELELKQAEGDSDAVEVEPITADFTTECESKGAKVDPVSVESEPTSIGSESKTDEVNNELELEQAEGDSDAVEVEPITSDCRAECELEAVEVGPVRVESDPTYMESEAKTEEGNPVNDELELVQAEGKSGAVEVEPVEVESEPTCIESESKTEDYGLVNHELEVKLADVEDESEVEVKPAGGEDESEAVEIEPVTIQNEPTCIESESKTVEVNPDCRELEVEKSRLSADSNEIPAECPVDQPESSQAVTDLSRIEEEEVHETGGESSKTEDEDFVIMRPDFLDVEDESDGLGPLRSRDSMSSVKSRESLGLLPPSYLANIDNDDLFISQVNSPSVLFGEKEKNYLKRVFKAQSPMYRGQQIVMQKSKRGRADANTPTSCRPKPFCEEQKRTPVKAVHSTTSKPALPNKVANSPVPNKAEKRPPTPTTTKGNSKAPRPSTLPCMAPQRAEIQGEKSTFAAFRAKVGTPVSKAPASPVSKSASVGDMKQPWIPPSPRPHLQRAPASPRARPASPFGTPKKSQSYESSGRVMTPQRDQAMTPKRDPPMTPTRTDPIQTKPRSNFKRPPVIATPPRVAANKKKPCTTATPPRCKATYSSSKSTTAGTLLTENEENAAPSVVVKKQATPRVKSGATSTPSLRNRTSISKPATPKVRSSTSKAAPIPNRGLSKPSQATSDSTESAKKKPASRPKLNSAAPKIGSAVSKINTGLAGRSDMRKLADKSKVTGTKPSATPATKRPVLGSLENKTSKQEETSTKSKPARTSTVTKSSSGDTAVTGAKTGAAAKTGIPSRSRIPAPRSRLPTKLPTRSNK